MSAKRSRCGARPRSERRAVDRQRGLAMSAAGARQICGHVSSFVQSISGLFRCCASSRLHEVVAVQLLLLDHGVGDPLDGVPVGGDEVLRRHVCLPEDLRCDRALVAVLEDRRRSGRRRSRRCPGCGSSAGGRSSRSAASIRLRVCSSVSSANLAPLSSIRCGPMPDAPTIDRRACSRVLEVAADAVDVLAVEDVLCGHRAEHVDEVAHRLAVPLAEALLLWNDW